MYLPLREDFFNRTLVVDSAIHDDTVLDLSGNTISLDLTLATSTTIEVDTILKRGYMSYS